MDNSSHAINFCFTEIFFLFAGHTHSPIDQNFSVVGKAIRRAAFIASPVAMNELFKVAHDINNQKSKIHFSVLKNIV